MLQASQNPQARNQHQHQSGMSTSSNRSAGRWYPTPPSASLVVITLIALYVNQSSRLPPGGSTTVFASAQNGAGKFATRAKLTSTSSKKKRPFWGNRRLEEVANEESDRDGEFDDSLWRRLWRAFDGGNSSSSWEWDLFLAESRMIIVSIIASVMCAFLPFIWYSMPGKRISARHDGEEGGGEFDVPSLIPPSSWYCLIVPFCLECLLATLLTQTHVSHKSRRRRSRV